MIEQDSGETLAEALRHPRYEIFPLDGVEAAVAGRVPKDIKLTVTASPKRGIEATLDLAGRLSEQGYRVVPHLSARLVSGRAHLEDILRRMAMYDKAPYATYIVSQICFDPGVISSWVRRVRNRGVGLPIYIGFPGVIDRQKLLRISTRIGLGESARFLSKNKHWLLRLFATGYRPEHLLRELATCLEDPALQIRGFHVYTFNEVARTEDWRREMLERLTPPRSEIRGVHR